MAARTKRRMVSIDPSKLTTIKRTAKRSRNDSNPFEITFNPFQKANSPHPQTQPANPVHPILWADTFSPSNPSQLAVHPKKLSLIHAWLNDALHGASHTRKYRRLLILAGPAGCGKSTIIHTLSKNLDASGSAPTTPNASSSRSKSKTAPAAPIRAIGYEILEWKNTGNESSVSKPQEFSLWLMRASAGPTLSFDDDEAGSSNLPLPSSSHQDKSTGTARSKRPTVLLVDDLPNLYHSETGRIFSNAIRQHLNSSRASAPPLIIIISDTTVTPGESGLEDSLAGRSLYSSGGGFNGEERGMNVHTLLPIDILQHPATCLIKLLPVNNTLMKKMLTRIGEQLYTSISTLSKPTLKDIDLVVEYSAGDLRAALNNLQLFFTIPSKKIDPAGRSRKALPSASPSLFNRQLLSSRDESLVIFHSLGKILYNKRWGDDAKEDAKDKRVRAPKPHSLPAFWCAYNRRLMKTDIDRLYSDLSVPVDQFVVYLHQNYPSFTDSIDNASFLLEYLSLSDATIAVKDQNRYSQSSTAGFYQFHITTRAILLGLPSPVTRRNQKFFKPALWANLRLLNENAALADSVRHQPGLLDHLHSDNDESHLNGDGQGLPPPIDPSTPFDAELLDRFSTFVYPNSRDAQADAILSEDEAPEPDEPELDFLPSTSPAPSVPFPNPLHLPPIQDSSLALDPTDDNLWFMADDDIVD